MDVRKGETETMWKRPSSIMNDVRHAFCLLFITIFIRGFISFIVFICFFSASFQVALASLHKEYCRESNAVIRACNKQFLVVVVVFRVLCVF